MTVQVQAGEKDAKSAFHLLRANFFQKYPQANQRLQHNLCQISYWSVNRSNLKKMNNSLRCLQDNRQQFCHDWLDSIKLRHILGSPFFDHWVLFRLAVIFFRRPQVAAINESARNDSDAERLGLISNGS